MTSTQHALSDDTHSASNLLAWSSLETGQQPDRLIEEGHRHIYIYTQLHTLIASYHGEWEALLNILTISHH